MDVPQFTDEEFEEMASYFLIADPEQVMLANTLATILCEDYRDKATAHFLLKFYYSLKEHKDELLDMLNQLNAE